jgi:penicillin-binding protein 1C
MRTALLLAVPAIAIGLGLFWLALGWLPDPLGREARWDYTVTLTDRHGLVLREIWPPPMGRRDLRRLDEFSPLLVEAVIAAEDKRFRLHPGVDPLAMLRALGQNLRGGKVVSGFSTITMQLARLSGGLDQGSRSIPRKLREIFLALRIERLHPKDEILALYLNSAPVGGPNVGFQAAAKAWLGKTALDLSPAEAAFLAGLPARPGRPGPFPSPNSLARKDMILRRLLAGGHLAPEEARRALEEPLALSQAGKFFRAPHFAAQAAKTLPALPPKTVATTIDLQLQERIEEMARATTERFKGQGLTQVAVVVLSVPEREVLAYVGSTDFFDPDEGQIDGVAKPRQPGSALKPFIYALGLERRALTASTLVNDEAADFVVAGGSYSPRNYSGASHGPVPARLALASSLNLPAVNLTSLLGVDEVLAYLRGLGLSTLSRAPEHYGLGLALGGGEVTLLDLSSAYAALADGGRLVAPVMILGGEEAARARSGLRQAISPGAAFIVSDILSDDQARATGFGAGGPLATPYPSSVKTGTSKNFRDNWCLGYTDGFVVGVWAGNFQARPMSRVSGITGAGHLWRAVADLLAELRPPARLVRPPGVEAVQVCPISGLPAGPDCPNLRIEYFLAGTAGGPRCDHPRMARPAGRPGTPVVGLRPGFGLLSPKSGEIYALDPGLPPEFQAIMAIVQAAPGSDELVVSHNGREIARRAVSGAGRASVPVTLARGRQVVEARALREGREIGADRAVFLVK